MALAMSGFGEIEVVFDADATSGTTPSMVAAEVPVPGTESVPLPTH